MHYLIIGSVQVTWYGIEYRFTKWHVIKVAIGSRSGRRYAYPIQRKRLEVEKREMQEPESQLNLTK